MPKKSTFISFKLEDIETQQYAVFPENFNPDNDNITISFGFGFGINTENKVIQCIPKIKLHQDKNTFLVLENAFLFRLTPETWDSLVSNNELTIPKGLKEHFLVVSVGTLRGIVFEKTNRPNSEIQKIVLPTMNVRSDTGNDLVFDLSENYNQEEEEE